MNQGKALNALSALANETRLELVRALIVCGDDGMAAGDIARQLDVSASRLSFHLSALEQAGLISSRKSSRNVFYAADATGIGEVISYLLNDCCSAHPEIRACCASGLIGERTAPSAG